MKLQRILAAAVLAVVITGAGDTPAMPATKFGPHITALIAEAQKEGKLQISWSGGSFGENGKGMPGWIDAFNRF